MLESVLTGLETYFESPWVRHIRIALQAFPEARITDALSRQQILSKKWAIESMHAHLGENLGNVFIVGGWYGTLAAMMFESGLFRNLQIRSFDRDPECEAIADTMNRSYVIDNWRFKASTADMYSLNYNLAHYRVRRASGELVELQTRPDLIINSSCEHLEDFSTWLARIPTGKKLVLQSNNFFASPDHKNCAHSLEEFAAQAKLGKIYFQDTLHLADYNRFMLIGEK